MCPFHVAITRRGHFKYSVYDINIFHVDSHGSSFNIQFYCSPASGICSRAATALIADRLSSSCFSYSCFTELAFTFVVHVALRGSTMRSRSTIEASSVYCIAVQASEDFLGYISYNSVSVKFTCHNFSFAFHAK